MMRFKYHEIYNYFSFLTSILPKRVRVDENIESDVATLKTVTARQRW